MRALKTLGLVLGLTLILYSCQKHQLEGIIEETSTSDKQNLNGKRGQEKIDFCKNGKIKSLPAFKFDHWVSKGYTPLIDEDGDGYVTEVNGCGLPFDCDDTDASINAGAEEICDDGLDNNCDGLTDGEDPDSGCDFFEIFTSQTDFEGACGGLAFEDFAGSVNGNFEGCASPINSTSGNCYPVGELVGGFSLSGDGEFDTTGDIFINKIGAFSISELVIGSNDITEPLNISFDSPVSSVGFKLFSGLVSADIVMEVFDSSGAIISIETLPNINSSGSFVGLSSSTGISTISLKSQGLALEFINNLYFGNCQ